MGQDLDFSWHRYEVTGGVLTIPTDAQQHVINVGIQTQWSVTAHHYQATYTWHTDNIPTH